MRSRSRSGRGHGPRAARSAVLLRVRNSGGGHFLAGAEVIANHRGRRITVAGFAARQLDGEVDLGHDSQAAAQAFCFFESGEGRAGSALGAAGFCGIRCHARGGEPDSHGLQHFPHEISRWRMGAGERSASDRDERHDEGIDAEIDELAGGIGAGRRWNRRGGEQVSADLTAAEYGNGGAESLEIKCDGDLGLAGHDPAAHGFVPAPRGACRGRRCRIAHFF